MSLGGPFQPTASINSDNRLFSLLPSSIPVVADALRLCPRHHSGLTHTICLPPLIAAQRCGPPSGDSSQPTHQVCSRLAYHTHGCCSSSTVGTAALKPCSLVRCRRSPPSQTRQSPLSARALAMEIDLRGATPSSCCSAAPILEYQHFMFFIGALYVCNPQLCKDCFCIGSIQEKIIILCRKFVHELAILCKYIVYRNQEK